MPSGHRPTRRRWDGRGARSARSRPPLSCSRTPRPAPSRPGARSRSPSPPATPALRRSGSRGRWGWMERPPRGRAQPRCRRETPPAESPTTEAIPPLPSPKRSPLHRHRGDYIVSAPARLSPRSFHLKEEMGGQEKVQSDIPSAFLRVPADSPPPPSRKPPSLPSVRSCPLPGCLILPGSSEKSEVTFLSLQSRSRLRAERLQGPLGDERAARDAVDGRGRAEQPRVCRERGGGEVPGTSKSRLNIYPYIIVLHCYPPRLSGPGRAGKGAPGVPRSFQGSCPSCWGVTVGPPVWDGRMWVGAPRTL